MDELIVSVRLMVMLYKSVVGISLCMVTACHANFDTIATYKTPEGYVHLIYSRGKELDQQQIKGLELLVQNVSVPSKHTIAISTHGEPEKEFSKKDGHVFVMRAESSPLSDKQIWVTASLAKVMKLPFK